VNEITDWLLEGAVKDTQKITPDWELSDRTLIRGVAVKEVKNVVTRYGFLTEIYRREWRLDDAGVDQVFQTVLAPGAVSAWHAHAVTTDRLFVNQGLVRIVLFDSRRDSPTYGLLNLFQYGTVRPGLVAVPPGVWHGIENVHHEPSSLLNLVDRAYSYEDPDHWRLPPDTDLIPYRFPGEPVRPASG
jgi:dTDP-4-dehydrorhamnose 3,5-epimerase